VHGLGYSNLLGFLLHLERGNEGWLILLESLRKLMGGEHVAFIDAPLQGDITRLACLHDTQSISVRYQVCLHRIREIVAQIELFVI